MRKVKQEKKEAMVSQQAHEFSELLNYIENLAEHKLGYPVSLLTYLGIVDNESLGILPGSLANILINNVGDPFKDSETSLMEVKKHERELIYILEKYYGLKKGDARGYVTTGGTEGNFAGLWWSKRYLINMQLDQLIAHDDIIKNLRNVERDLNIGLQKIPTNSYQERNSYLQKIIDVTKEILKHKNDVQQLLTPTVFYTKNHTHYSIPKIAEILRLNIKTIDPIEDGSMDLKAFHREMILHAKAHPLSPIIVIANIGTTITGAIDPVPEIKKILDGMPNPQIYTIHLDGALTGFVLPILKPFGDVKNYFDAIGANTLAVSAHKYPGLSQPCGIMLARKEFFEKAFEKSERSIDYVGNIVDITITGSRSGLNVLMFYNALYSLGLHEGTKKLEQMVADNISMAKYLYNRLVEVYGEGRIYYPHHFNVMFPKPSAEMAKKYQLMITGERATICVLSNVTRPLVDQFIVDLKKDKEKVAMTQTSTQDYQITRLSKEHLDGTVNLITQCFCNDEPITKEININKNEYEHFAKDVVEKAIKDGLSTIALDKSGKVIACCIAEDITKPFQPTLADYPKMLPILTLLDELSAPLLEDKNFQQNKVAHVWIACVDAKYRGQNLYIDVDKATSDHLKQQGYDFVVAEFTNAISEKISNHYKDHEEINRINYSEFTMDGKKPFSKVKGGASVHVIVISDGVQLSDFEETYKITEKAH